MRSHGILALGILRSALFWAVPSEAAQEQRCRELDEYCVCSSRLDQTSFASVGNGFYRAKALDGDDKACSTNSGHHEIYSSSATPQAVTNCFGSWPCWRDTMTSTGVSAVTPTSSQLSSLSGRVAARYYIRLSSNYQTMWEGDCTNDKYVQIPDWIIATTSGWALSRPGDTFPGTPLVSSTREKWLRLEVIMDRRPATQHCAYLKNVTDDTPEVGMCVLPEFGQHASNWGVNMAIDIVHKYREGACAGHADLMFAMMAHWPNPIGTERIGPAIELEGSLMSNDKPPSAPTGLTVR